MLAGTACAGPTNSPNDQTGGADDDEEITVPVVSMLVCEVWASGVKAAVVPLACHWVVMVGTGSLWGDARTAGDRRSGDTVRNQASGVVADERRLPARVGVADEASPDLIADDQDAAEITAGGGSLMAAKFNTVA